MADGEAERESGLGPDVTAEIPRLEERLQELENHLRIAGGGGGEDEAVQAASDYCQRFCQTLLEYAEKWKASEDSLPLLEVYTVAIQSYSKARPHLTSKCENVGLVLERLALSCVELLLCLPQELPDNHWEKFQGSIKVAHKRLTENGSHELMLLFNLSQEAGVWKDPVLDNILNGQVDDPSQAEGFFFSEGPFLLEMRIKQLLKVSKVAPATSLAKLCSDHPEMSKKGHFKQLYLTCLCAASPNIRLIEEIAKVDCKDALEMICNLESEGDEKTSLILCAAFLSRQLQFGEMYCAWELTLFWSKLQRRVDPSIQVYLEICRQLSQLTKTVYHIFFLIKVIQSETETAGLPTCIELCVRALRLESSENAKVKISICKTISCLLPDDLEVKRACQLTEFLLEPTVDAYYAVEMLYNQPDQKYDEESLPVPNSLRCELLLVLKTRWPFDPEFWDWKTLKRQCLALMGEEASIVSSIDELNDNEAYDQVDDYQELGKDTTINGLDFFNTTPENEVFGQKTKKKPIRKMKEQGCISARFRNWQAYMQYCVLCDKEFLGHRIIRHAQKHCTNGIYSCPICAKQYTTKESFVPHVTLHVKQSCKERLETMGPLRKLRLPKKAQPCKSKKPVTVTKQERQVKKNTMYSDDFIVFNDNDNSDENDDKDNQTVSLQEEKPAVVNEFPCPVTFCNKGFKYFKNLIAHVRGHRDSEEAARFLEIQSKKVVCQYCRRQFVSLTHLNDHLQMHCGSQPYICIQMKCKASFETYTDLLSHKKEHRDFRAKCMFPKCGRIFTAAYMLFDHEAQHYNTFTCKISGCGKIFRSQLQLEQHLCEHSTKTDTPQLIKTEELTEAFAGGECFAIKETSLPNAETLHSADAPSSTMAKEPCLTETSLLEKKVDPVAQGGLENSMHLLIPPPNNLSTTNLLTQVLPTPSGTQAMLPKTDILDNTTFPADAINVKLPSLAEGFLLNQSKFIASSESLEENKAQLGAQPGFQAHCLSVFQEGKHGCQDYPNKNPIGSIAPSEIKIEAEQQLSSMMPFNETAQLCENNLVVPGYDEGTKPENLLSLSLETSNALSDVLPPASDVTLPPVRPAPLERFKCNVEGCTRIYNSVQSIGKHMKSTHPDHYDSFKMERKNRKKQKPSIPSADEKPTYCILPGPDIPNNSVFQSQLQSPANPSFCNQLQHLPNPVFPAHLESLVNPLLSSVETAISQELSKNVTETLMGPEVGNLSNAALTSQIEDLAKVLPMKFENGSDPFLPMPTENDPLPVMSSLSGSTMFSQLGGNSDHVLAGGAAANSVFLKDVEQETSFSKPVDGADMDASFNLDKSSSMLSNAGDNKSPSRRPSRNRERTSKHSARAKCPAIIRDGKFICSRCYRVFTNPRSLGGHLSKRTVCKPHNDYDISPDVPQRDGQPSVLASMILSSTPKPKAKSPAQTFTSNMAIKEEPFLSPVQPENEANQYLQTQNIAAPHPLDIRTLNPNMSSHECIANSSAINSVETLNTTPINTLPTSASFKDEFHLGNAVVNNCTNIAGHPEGNPLKTENGFCPKSVINSIGGNNCLPKPASSARVSVISGPQSSTTKKKSSSSKKKKKTDKPAAVEASHELAKNLLAAVGGNLQMSTELQPAFMTYGSDLLENLAKHFGSADKELLMSCINESLKANSETHAICPLPIKTEKSESPLIPSNTPDCKDAEKLDLHPDFRERSFNNMTPDTSEVYSLNANVQKVFSALPQSQSNVNSSIDVNVPMVLHNKTTASCSSPDKMNIPVCSVSPTQESGFKYDEQVLEIIDLVQKLQILDTGTSEFSVAEAKCPLGENPPIMSSVIVPNPSVNIVSEEIPEVSSSLVDKCNGKPFVCQEKGCSYCAMTKDALFKHYSKVHYYTTEKLGEIRKHQLKFAPFRCVVPTCTKTFTRNSNLRAHCQAMHHFTSEQMVKLKIKRPYGRKSASESTDFSPPEMPGSPEAKRFMESQDLSQEIKPEPGTCQEVPLLKTMVPHKLQKSKDSPSLPYEDSQLAFNQKNKKGSKIRKRRKEKDLKRKMQKDGAALTSYKPYQCVHQGCTAAFTIQQNLILHYQAVHKSEASQFLLDEDRKDDQEEGSNCLLLREFRCTESDCSRIFSSFASLIQHYVKLHEMIAEEIENIVTFVNGGSFKCDQTQCTATFTTCTGYIDHLDEVHSLKLKRVKLEGEEMYKCDIEGCDRIYATRSNMLRHIFRKHKDKHKEHLIRPRKISVSDQDNTDEKTPKEKSRVPKTKPVTEGAEVSKAKRCKGSNGEKAIKSATGKDKSELSSLKYGRHTYSLKTKDVALAECNDLHAKQYPCMVRGCKSVVTSEHSIIRHYKCHKLSRAFILKHRNTLIVCKKRGRPKVKEVSLSLNTESAVDLTKAEVKDDPSEATDPHQKQPSATLLESSDESTVSTTQQSENEKNEMDELTELFISKLSNEDSTSSESQVRPSSLESCDFQETSSCQSEPQRIVSVVKRPNKQKQATPNRKRKIEIPEEALSAETSSTLSCEENIQAVGSPEDTPAFDLSSFKPMGFEVSFLKFLEESAVKEKKTVERVHCKTDTEAELKPSEKRPRLSEDEDFDTDIYLLFSNPSHLPNMDNVRIVLDEAFNDYIELVVKQLNELKPVVVLKHDRYCSEFSSSAKEQNIDIDEEASV